MTLLGSSAIVLSHELALHEYFVQLQQYLNSCKHQLYTKAAYLINLFNIFHAY